MRAMLPMLVLLAVPADPGVTPAVPAVKAAPALPTVAAKAPRVEVTFVLDTTGSMGGLIEGAKRRIWSIARRIGEGRPRPDLRIALVGYRDKGDEYVTRVHDLSGDMDEVYAQLSAFRAEGGGDFPEHVSRGALTTPSIGSPGRQDSALRLIFLVGDAPPHMDYQDGFDYRRHVREARAARDRGRDDPVRRRTPRPSRSGARSRASGGGHYAQIDGQGGMPVRVTAADAELARLNAELATTVVAGRLFGRAGRGPGPPRSAEGHARADGRGGGRLLRARRSPRREGPRGHAGGRAEARPGPGRCERRRSRPPRGQERSRSRGLSQGPEGASARRSRLASLELQKQREAELAKEPSKDAFDEKVVSAPSRRRPRPRASSTDRRPPSVGRSCRPSTTHLLGRSRVPGRPKLSPAAIDKGRRAGSARPRASSRPRRSSRRGARESAGPRAARRRGCRRRSRSALPAAARPPRRRADGSGGRRGSWPRAGRSGWRPPPSAPRRQEVVEALGGIVHDAHPGEARREKGHHARVDLDRHDQGLRGARARRWPG